MLLSEHPFPCWYDHVPNTGFLHQRTLWNSDKFQGVPICWYDGQAGLKSQYGFKKFTHMTLVGYAVDGIWLNYMMERLIEYMNTLYLNTSSSCNESECLGSCNLFTQKRSSVLLAFSVNQRTTIGWRVSIWWTVWRMQKCEDPEPPDHCRRWKSRWNDTAIADFLKAFNLGLKGNNETSSNRQQFMLIYSGLEEIPPLKLIQVSSLSRMEQQG